MSVSQSASNRGTDTIANHILPQREVLIQSLTTSCLKQRYRHNRLPHASSNTGTNNRLPHPASNRGTDTIAYHILPQTEVPTQSLTTSCFRQRYRHNRLPHPASNRGTDTIAYHILLQTEVPTQSLTTSCLKQRY